MARINFVNLQVYQLSEKLADGLWDFVRGWSIFARDTIGKQMLRAADSIGANIAEGTGRGSYQDNRRFVRMARGSLYETQHWLRRAYRRRLLTSEQTANLKEILDNLCPMLNAYLKSIGPQRSENRDPPP